MMSKLLVALSLVASACDTEPAVRPAPAPVAPVIPRPPPPPRVEAPPPDDGPPTLASLCALPRNEVYFAPRSSELTAAAKALVADVAACLASERGRDAKLIVVGHAHGGKRAAKRLADARAKAITRELARGGVDKARVRAATLREDGTPLRSADGKREHGVTMVLDPEDRAAASAPALPSGHLAAEPTVTET